MTAPMPAATPATGAKGGGSRPIAWPGRFRRRVPLHCCRLLLALAFVLAAGAAPAYAKDDNENNTPAAWWIGAGQSIADIGKTLQNDNARIVDIAADDAAFPPFTVAYVQNTGSYAKSWW